MQQTVINILTDTIYSNEDVFSFNEQQMEIILTLVIQRLSNRLESDMKNIKSVTIKGEIVEMNEKNYHLLEYFLLNKGILLFKEQIFDRICGYQSDASTDIIEVYMSRLRKVLSPFGYDRYIVTKRGMGYMLDETK